VQVEWDPAKNFANQRKHGVSFEEASALFRSGAEFSRFSMMLIPAQRIVSSRWGRFDAG
jgi:uncharacterized DUF497 family protein